MENTVKPLYTKNGDEVIFKELRKEVRLIVSSLESSRGSMIIFKAILLPLIYFGIYLSALLLGANALVLFSCYFLMGLLLVSIFLNVIHDAVHGSIFKSDKANKLYVYLFDLMGANSFIWKQRHIRFHHNYPNVNGWDTDIEQSNLARIFPSAGISKMHRYQN